MTSQHDANPPQDPNVPQDAFVDQNDQAQGADGLLQDEDVVLSDQIQELEAQLAEAKDMALRAYAESENIRRRSQEEVAKTRKFAIESFAESLVPVRDSLEAALAQKEQTLESLVEGVETTLKQLNGAFERHHLKEIAPEVGDRFDPHLHQAIASVPAEQPSNTVVTVLQKGYLITDRVLRPALVTVAN